MASFGEPWEGDSPFEQPNYVMLRKGVLMGDPLTKPVLHLVNILVRTVGANYSEGQFLEKIFQDKTATAVFRMNRLIGPSAEHAVTHTPATPEPHPQRGQGSNSSDRQNDAIYRMNLAVNAEADAKFPKEYVENALRGRGPVLEPVPNPLGLSLDFRKVLQLPVGTQPVLAKLSVPAVDQTSRTLSLSSERLRRVLDQRQKTLSNAMAHNLRIEDERRIKGEFTFRTLSGVLPRPVIERPTVGTRGVAVDPRLTRSGNAPQLAPQSRSCITKYINWLTG